MREMARDPKLMAASRAPKDAVSSAGSSLAAQRTQDVWADSIHQSPRMAAQRKRIEVVQLRLDTALPDVEFRKADVTESMKTEMRTSAHEFALAVRATRVQHGVLAGLHIDTPQADRLAEVLAVASRLLGHLEGKFSAAKRGKLLADHARVRAAEAQGLAASASAEINGLYAVPHVPSGNTLNKKLKGIFASAAQADVTVTLPVLRSLIRATGAEDRAAAASNPRLLDLAIERVHRDAFADYVVELGVQQAGTVAQTSAANADELIRAKMAEWAPERDIGGLSIAGHVAILKGDAWQHLVQSLFAGRVPGGEMRNLLDTTNAFEREGKVYVNADRGNAGTMIHEGVHKYAPNTFLARFGEPINEGVTEFFARQICQTQRIVRTQYQPRFEAAAKLVALAGEATVRRAYFGGEVGALDGIQVPAVD